VRMEKGCDDVTKKILKGFFFSFVLNYYTGEKNQITNKNNFVFDLLYQIYGIRRMTLLVSKRDKRHSFVLHHETKAKSVFLCLTFIVTFIVSE
jgi:hypothetical protein